MERRFRNACAVILAAQPHSRARPPDLPGVPNLPNPPAPPDLPAPPAVVSYFDAPLQTDD